MKISGRKDAPVKSSFLTIISHKGPTHLQRVSPSLGEFLWQTGPPYLPVLTHAIIIWAHGSSNCYKAVG